MSSSFSQFISPYVVSEEVADWCAELQNKTPFHFKVTKSRSSKLGDYRYQKSWRGKSHEITINHNLGKDLFLFTFLHELAHRTTMEKYGRRVKPHGKEWKLEFSILLTAALQKGYFPDNLRSAIHQHAKNPKASYSSDKDLFLLFDRTGNDLEENATYLSTLEVDNLFLFKNEAFRILKKNRTRMLCLNIKNNRKYYISQLAKVSLLEK